jgi:hypothetical protein
MQVLVTPALCFLTTLQCVDRVESAMIIPQHHSYSIHSLFAVEIKHSKIDHQEASKQQAAAAVS